MASVSITITITTKEHKHQRYPTVGDWLWLSDNDLVIYVSKMGDWHKEILVGLHEVVEAILCKNQGISQELVDKFDIEYERKRKKDSVEEPGNDPKAPYQREHFIAEIVERLVCAELGIHWNDYEKTINSL